MQRHRRFAGAKTDSKKGVIWRAALCGLTLLTAVALLTAGCALGPVTPEPSPSPTPPSAASEDTQPVKASSETQVCGGECVGPIMATVDVVDNTGFHGMSQDLAQAAELAQVGPVAGVIAAQDVIDNTGFHGMAEEIEAAESMEDVNPYFLHKVRNALTASQAAPYPAALSGVLASFQEDAKALADALDRADLEAAKEAAEGIHASQHELSHSGYEWLAERQGGTSEGIVAVVNVMAAQDAIDSTGFHGMAEELEKAEGAKDVNPRFLGKVRNAARVSQAAPYPDALTAQLSTFQEDARALADALESSDLGAAQEAAKAIHHSQHELSSAVYEWFAKGEGDAGEGLLGVVGVMAAQDVIDSTGFHGMSEEIGEAENMKDVNPYFLHKAENALTASRAAPYPEELTEQLAAFQRDVQALADALNAGELEGAKGASESVHHSQHELSSAAYEWLGAQDGEELLAGLINPRYLGKVENALAASQATPWYGDLAGKAEAFEADLRSLADALSAGDVRGAAEASHAVHETQHALSHTTYEWLASVPEGTARVDAIMAAQDIIDNTGFHGMAEEIEAAESMEDVNPRDLGKVEKALAVAGVVAWPEGLSEPAGAFQADVEALADALEAGDLAAAKASAEAIHGSQHELSHHVYEWLGSQKAAATGIGAVVGAVDIIDSTGFHGMSEEIEAAESMKDVNPRYLGKVQKALTVAQVGAWPEDLSEAVQAFRTDAQALADALEAGDLGAAQEAAKAIHHSQHELSHSAYGWLGSAQAAAFTASTETSFDETTSTAEDEKYADAPVVQVEVSDWEWDPSTIRLTKGEPVVLAVENTGEMPHGIWIPELAVNVLTPPGEVTEVNLTPEKAGDFLLGCNNPMCGPEEKHDGMEATVVVESN